MMIAALFLAVSPWYFCLCAQQTHASGHFDLTVSKSSALTPGTNHLDAGTASAVYTSEFFRGRVNGLKVQMPGSNGNTAYFVLLLDSTNRITQVDLTIVVPGKTVARTIAWTPSALQASFSNARFDGTRLRLLSKGSYDSLKDTPNEALTMSWDVDIDVPVVRAPARPRAP
jgi:hypothetical protein